MPNWMLTCHRCKTRFVHTRILARAASVTDLNPFVWPLKPDLPSGGFNAECPKCKASSVYRREELTYGGD